MKKILTFALILTMGMTSIYAYSNNEHKTATGGNSFASEYITDGNSLTGQIVQTMDYSPINSANIYVSGKVNKSIISNQNGIFEIAGLPEGDYTIIITYPGHKSLKMNIRISNHLTDLGIIEIE